ncbi:MAG TPA: hypothetical protein VGK41_05405 [Solirubrobacterales bacterium]
MVVAGGIKVGLGGKPKDLIELVDVLVGGAPDGKGGSDASDSEYIDEQWWPNEDEAKGANGGRGGDDP